MPPPVACAVNLSATPNHPCIHTQHMFSPENEQYLIVTEPKTIQGRERLPQNGCLYQETSTELSLDQHDREIDHGEFVNPATNPIFCTLCFYIIIIVGEIENTDILAYNSVMLHQSDGIRPPRSIAAAGLYNEHASAGPAQNIGLRRSPLRKHGPKPK